jgi:hypothetical protein
MLRSPSTKLAFGVLAAVLFVVALLGIVYKYAEQRTRMRVHVGAATGGDPLRGESMFSVRLLQLPRHQGRSHRNGRSRTAARRHSASRDHRGRLSNTPDNMEKWIRDITAFLYTRAK